MRSFIIQSRKKVDTLEKCEKERYLPGVSHKGINIREGCFNELGRTSGENNGHDIEQDIRLEKVMH